MTGVYSEHRAYSPVFDAEVIRYSMCDAHGGEFYVLVPEAEPGRSTRGARDQALEMIEQAIAQGLQPGLVRAK